MSQRKRDAQSTVWRVHRLIRRGSIGMILLASLLACSYEPLSDAEKAGIGAAGAEPDLGEDDTTSDSTSGTANTSSNSTSGAGGAMSASSTESSTGSGSTSSGGSSSETSASTGGTDGGGGGTGGTTTDASAGTSNGSGGNGGTGGTEAGSGGSSGSSGTGGVSGSGGTSGSSAHRYVRLVALSSQNGNPFSSVAELELLDAGGQPLDNSGWTASADSEETTNEMAPASYAIDGDTDTFWHTEWGSFDAPLPHYLQIDLGAAQEISGFVYTPRQDGQQNGWILNWEIYLSNSASDPGTAVDSGSFSSGSTPKAVNLP